jgi:hypothetical protein
MGYTSCNVLILRCEPPGVEYAWCTSGVSLFVAPEISISFEGADDAFLFIFASM